MLDRRVAATGEVGPPEVALIDGRSDAASALPLLLCLLLLSVGSNDRAGVALVLQYPRMKRNRCTAGRRGPHLKKSDGRMANAAYAKIS